MPAPLLGELLGKSKMGARLAANLAMGSTPKSKAGKAAHADSWRRDTAAEAAAKPASKSRSKQGG